VGAGVDESFESNAMFGGGGDKDEQALKARWSKCGFLSKLPMSQLVLLSIA
jgi:hypothetical protein